MTKMQKAINYLDTHRESGLTPLEALNVCGSMRLPAIICALKKRGYEFETTSETKTGPDGEVRYARYRLLRTPEEVAKEKEA